MCANTLIKNRLLKPRLTANIKEVQQRLYASIKMGIFDKSNNVVNTNITEQVFRRAAQVPANALEMSAMNQNEQP